MTDQPLSLHEMLLRALRSQVDLGLGECIIGRTRSQEPALAPLPTPFETGMQMSAARKEEVTIAVSPGDGLLQMSMLGGDTGLSSPLGDAVFDSSDSHNQAICTCKLCPLGDGRTKFVYGVGNPKAKLMFIGEAPGAQEDLQGEPFVGAAGQLLDKILAAIQLSRKEVYIANILKCRPPNNRDPLPSEIEKCLPYLHEQMRIIRPKLLCCLGRIAAQALLQTTTPLGRLRHKWHDYHGIPMQVTYHPAALLRFPDYKRETWEDMKVLKARYDQL